MLSRRRFMQAVGGMAAAAMLPGCAKPEQGRPNVLLITIETTRRDHCTLYGYRRNTTPFLEELAREAVVFEDAWSQAGWTKPSVASMLTGRLPGEHGCHAGPSALPPELPTLAGLLGRGGYHTGAVWANECIDRPRYGYGRGFDQFRPLGDRVRCDVVCEHGLDWLRSAQVPWLLSLHVWDPHEPYEPPSEHDIFDPADYLQLKAPYQRAHYDGELHYTDAALGRFVSALRGRNQWDNALVILTSDHGESLLDHPLRGVGHGAVMWAERLAVPLIIKLPGGAYGGRRISGKAAGIDLLPTICDACDVAAPPALAGASLLPAVKEGTTGREFYVSSAYQDRRGFEQRTAISDGFHSIRSEGTRVASRFYELKHHHWGWEEKLVTGGQHKAERTKHREALEQWRDRLVIEHFAPEAKMDEDALRKLRDLGYL